MLTLFNKSSLYEHAINVYHFLLIDLSISHHRLPQCHWRQAAVWWRRKNPTNETRKGKTSMNVRIYCWMSIRDCQLGHFLFPLRRLALHVQLIIKVMFRSQSINAQVSFKRRITRRSKCHAPCLIICSFFSFCLWIRFWKSSLDKSNIFFVWRIQLFMHFNCNRI